MLLRLWQIPMIESTLAVTGGSAVIAVPLLAITASETLLVTPSSAIALQVFMQGLVGGVISVVALIGAARALPVHVSALLPVFTPVVALGIASVVLGTVPNAAKMAGTLIIATAFMISSGILKRKKVANGKNRHRSLIKTRPIRPRAILPLLLNWCFAVYRL
ncbi:hypothetical protein [uncultured Tateyamaria sp.]|uniref:hypothetical protein n=1 Tax=uncultured Tateyamaria sp. TaxID=455651 RepID=UPI0026221F7C|nr:hypothetical protein [uncultured Tateyamaria sp.]